MRVDQAEYKKSEISVLQYAVLLDNICVELESERAFFGLFLSDQCPARVVVHKSAPDNFAVVVQEKIKVIKRYVKAIQRDLTVSYSRYCYGFDAQLKRIVYVESFVKKEDE